MLFETKNYRLLGGGRVSGRLRHEFGRDCQCLRHDPSQGALESPISRIGDRIDVRSSAAHGVTCRHRQ